MPTWFRFILYVCPYQGDVTLRLHCPGSEVTTASGFHSDPIKPAWSLSLVHSWNTQVTLLKLWCIRKQTQQTCVCWQMLQGLWIKVSLSCPTWPWQSVLLPQSPLSWVYRFETRLSWDLFVLCLTQCRLFLYWAFSSCLTLKKNSERWVFFPELHRKRLKACWVY